MKQSVVTIAGMNMTGTLETFALIVAMITMNSTKQNMETNHAFLYSF